MVLADLEVQFCLIPLSVTVDYDNIRRDIKKKFLYAYMVVLNAGFMMHSS